MADLGWLGEFLGLEEKKLPESPTYHPGDLVELLNSGNFAIVTGYFWNHRHLFWEYCVLQDGIAGIYSCRVMKLVQSMEKNGIIEV
jgi:hypothetical protein